LEVGAFFGDDRPFDGTNLETNAAINTGRKIDPIPIGAFGIFAGALVNASYRAGCHTIRYTLTNIRHNRMRHYQSSKIYSD
jgi:hypothetical protein